MVIVKSIGMWILFGFYLLFIVGRMTLAFPFSLLAYIGYRAWLRHCVAKVRKSSNDSIAETFRLNHTKRFREFLVTV